MRVMQAMAGGRVGGAEAFFERLVAALGAAGIEQRAVIRRDGARAARLAADGIAVAELPFGGPFDFRTGPALGREIAAFRPDVVLSWMSRATAFVPGRRFRRRHPFVHVARLGGHYPLRHYRDCDWLVANTRGVADYLVGAGWPARRLRVIPNFVEAADAAPRPRADFGTPEGAPLLLALGRLHPNKGFDVLIRALARVPDAHLWLAGEGPEERALRDLAAASGVGARVRFLGWQREVAPLYRAADLYACASRVEPLGNVVLEAWAHGLPVVAAAAAGPAELIADGASGVLVPAGDADALADAIRRLLGDADLCRRLADGGRRAHAAGFTREAVVAAYAAFFGEVTG